MTNIRKMLIGIAAVMAFAGAYVLLVGLPGLSVPYIPAYPGADKVHVLDTYASPFDDVVMRVAMPQPGSTNIDLTLGSPEIGIYWRLMADNGWEVTYANGCTPTWRHRDGFGSGWTIELQEGADSNGTPAVIGIVRRGLNSGPKCTGDM